jgi:DNA-binding MarR family transcriptional regulator
MNDGQADGKVQHDRVDAIIAQWNRERPEVDVSPMQVVGRILRAARYLDAALEDVFRKYELDFGLFDVLATLRRSGPPYALAPRALNRWCMLSSGAMTKRLDRLERLGLIARKADPNDRRGVQVVLSAAGLELVDEVVVAHVKNEERLLATLSDEERADLAGLLRQLLVVLEPGHELPARRTSLTVS